VAALELRLVPHRHSVTLPGSPSDSVCRLISARRSGRTGARPAGDLRRAARDHCRRASHAAFRARNPVCSARAAVARAGDSLNARPPRAVAKPRATSGGRFCEVLLRARTKGRAKSWTLHSVADAKWSTTGNFQVASCLWTSSCFVDDILDLGSTFNTFKKFSRKSQRITEHISGRRRMCHLRHPVGSTLPQERCPRCLPYGKALDGGKYRQCACWSRVEALAAEIGSQSG
jgi:hypothetical protein